MEKVVIENPEIIGSEVVYDGYFKVSKYTVKDLKKEYIREVLEVKNSVSAIVYDTVKQKYIFTKQWRPGTQGYIVEIVAGSMDVVGERPEEALKREIVEEIGYKMDTCTHIRDFYVSPGGVTEIISLYYVEVSEKVSDGGGIGDEDIEVIEVDYLGVMGTLFFNPKDNVITPPYRLIDAKSIIAVNYVEMNRILGDMSNVLTQVRMNGF